MFFSLSLFPFIPFILFATDRELFYSSRYFRKYLSGHALKMIHFRLSFWKGF